MARPDFTPTAGPASFDAGRPLPLLGERRCRCCARAAARYFIASPAYGFVAGWPSGEHVCRACAEEMFRLIVAGAFGPPCEQVAEVRPLATFSLRPWTAEDRALARERARAAQWWLRPEFLLSDASEGSP